MSTNKWQSRQTMTMPNKFEIFHYCDSYVTEVNVHHHDFYEIYYFIKGNVNYNIEGTQYALQNGDILLISPQELHQMSNLGNSDYERFVLWISDNWLKTISSDKTDLSRIFTVCTKTRNNKCPATTNESKTILDFFTRISKLKQSTIFGDDIRANVLLADLLLFLNEIYLKNDIVQNTPDNIIEKAVDYINKHMTDNINVADIAEYLYLSVSRLSHLFRQKTGTSVYQYIIKRRLITAKSLILMDTPAGEVAEKCGFCNYAGFLKLFKKEYGMTPSQYYNTLSNKY